MNEKINVKKLTLCLMIIFAAISQAAAHKKWFHETKNYCLRWDLFSVCCLAYLCRRDIAHHGRA